MPEYAIFDFDGTLTNLGVDWTSLKRQLSVNTLSEVWNFPENEFRSAAELISSFEISGLGKELKFDIQRLRIFDQFSVLTNNSERTVKIFFDRLNASNKCSEINPTEIVGRETLLAPKESASSFQRGIQLILTAMNIPLGSECFYIGDQDYELDFAGKLGLKPLSITDFL